MTGFEPATNGLETRHSTVELHPHKLERVVRFELTTISLATKHSTTELYPHFKLVSGQGLEPRFTESKSVVLPLDDPEIVQTLYSIYASSVKH